MHLWNVQIRAFLMRSAFEKIEAEVVPSSDALRTKIKSSSVR
jgi:hypothetical protein